MKFKLNDIQYVDITYQTKTSDKNITSELSTTLNLSFISTELPSNRFDILFEVELKSKKTKLFKLKIKALAHFEASEKITESFSTSPLARINAPAIAFPYIRAFISNLTLNAGYNPVLLPTFNFVALATESKTQKDSEK
ncbi:MAG: protein-export chaperone SecB [Saprospiraceae bacterium]|nr:protein-export chaperone SecB [Saprospiraceae bacterium]